VRQLGRAAEAAVAVLGQHAEHVRPLQHLPGLHADNRVDEPDHAVGLVVGADQDGAALHRDREDGQRHHVVQVGEAPDLGLQVHHLAEFVGGVQIAEAQLRHRSDECSESGWPAGSPAA